MVSGAIAAEVVHDALNKPRRTSRRSMSVGVWNLTRASNQILAQTQRSEVQILPPQFKPRSGHRKVAFFVWACEDERIARNTESIPFQMLTKCSQISKDAPFQSLRRSFLLSFINVRVHVGGDLNVGVPQLCLR